MKSADDGSRLSEIMTTEEVAAWLKVKPRQVGRLGIPQLDLGHRTKRYLVQDVAGWLEAQRQGTTLKNRRDISTPDRH